MHRPIRSRRPRVLAGVALLAVAALTAAGCSSTTASRADGTSPLPGISADTVKIGYAMVDNGELQETLGFVQPQYGDMPTQKKSVEAVIAHINANGGMGGRQVELVTNFYPALNDNPANSLAQCNSFTQDLEVFAVVLDGGLQNNAVPCYAQANTLVLDQTLVAHDQAQFEKHAPYLWSVTHPEYGGFMKAQLETMNSAGYFEDSSKVLLMAGDDEVSRRTTDAVVKPYLSTIGITNPTTNYIDSTNTGTLGATISEALTTAKSVGANRIVVVGGARITPVALADVLAKQIDARWSISTADTPAFVERNSAALQESARIGMVGLGYAPATDVNQEQGPAFPDPNQPYQVKCHEIISSANAGPPEDLRVNWKNALQYCDAAMFLKAVLDNLPGADEITGDQFAEAAGKIGPTYQSSLSFGSSWGPGMFAGTNTAMQMEWDESIKAFVYSGEPVTFGTIAAPPASIAPTTGGEPTAGGTDGTPTDGAPTAGTDGAVPGGSPDTSAPAAPPAPTAPGSVAPGGTGGDAWPSA